jgi:hypothetical protein
MRLTVNSEGAMEFYSWNYELAFKREEIRAKEFSFLADRTRPVSSCVLKCRSLKLGKSEVMGHSAVSQTIQKKQGWKLWDLFLEVEFESHTVVWLNQDRFPTRVWGLAISRSFEQLFPASPSPEGLMVSPQDLFWEVLPSGYLAGNQKFKDYRMLSGSHITNHWAKNNTIEVVLWGKP